MSLFGQGGVAITKHMVEITLNVWKEDGYKGLEWDGNVVKVNPLGNPSKEGCFCILSDEEVEKAHYSDLRMCEDCWIREYLSNVGVNWLLNEELKNKPKHEGVFVVKGTWRSETTVSYFSEVDSEDWFEQADEEPYTCPLRILSSHRIDSSVNLSDLPF